MSCHRLQQIGDAADTATRLQIDGLLDWLRTQRQDSLTAERDARAELFCARCPVQTAGRQSQGDAERARIPCGGPESLLEAALRQACISISAVRAAIGILPMPGGGWAEWPNCVTTTMC